MRCILIYWCFLLLLLSGSELMASSTVSPNEEVQRNFQQLIETNSCPKCNLSGAILNRIDLSGANLEGANLAGAQLYLATLAGANLRNANLQGAALGGADLADADLHGANLTGAVIEGAYMVGAQMDGEVVTRRPYLEEGGPEVGEKVYIDDQASSKDLPFTNKAFVTEQQKAETNEMIAAEPAVQTEPEKNEDKPVQSPEVFTAPEESTDQGEKKLEQDYLPEKSKKLALMADAVIPQKEIKMLEQSAPDGQHEEQVPVTSSEAVKSDSEMENFSRPDVEKSESVHAMAMDTEAADSQESALQNEQERDSDGMIQPMNDRSVQKEMEQPDRKITGMPQTTEEDVSGQKILDREMIVAEAVSSDTVSSGQAMTSVEEKVDTAAPIEQESLPESEKDVIAVIEPPDIPQETAVPAEQPGKEPAAPSQTKKEGVMDQPAPEQQQERIETVKVVDDEKKILVEKLLDDNHCVGCDLAGVDLSGKDLDEADLERAILREANLSGADLNEANLKGADLQGADLSKADLRKADLYRANLDKADLTGARFEDALIDMISTSGAVGADFTGALTGD